MNEMREDRREGAALCLWLDAMGQRLSHAFMNAYFKQDPSRANLCCSPEWGCWLRANYTLQIWPLVTTVLIWHSLDSGLGACLWAKAPDSHASVSTHHWRKMSVCMMHAGRLLLTDAIINAFILTGCTCSQNLLSSALSALASFLSFFLLLFLFLGAGGDVYTEGKVVARNRRHTDVCGMYKVKVWQRSKDGGATQLPAAPMTPQQWREKTLHRHLCVKDKYIHSSIAPGHWLCVCTCVCVCLFV